MQHSFAFDKSQRLSHSAIQYVFQNIEKRIDTFYATFLLTTSPSESAGVAIIVAKKKVKKAVQRNLCKRVYREFFRLNQNHLGHAWMVVIVKKSANEASKAQLWASIDFLKN